MARRRSYGRRYYGRAKRFYGRRKGLLGGSMGNVVIGAVAGAISPYIPNVVGAWTKPVVFGGLGYVLKKPALLTIAGYEAGKMIPSMFGMGGGNGNGGFY